MCMTMHGNKLMAKLHSITILIYSSFWFSVPVFVINWQWTGIHKTYLKYDTVLLILIEVCNTIRNAEEISMSYMECQISRLFLLNWYSVTSVFFLNWNCKNIYIVAVILWMFNLFYILITIANSIYFSKHILKIIFSFAILIIRVFIPRAYCVYTSIIHNAIDFLNRIHKWIYL